MLARWAASAAFLIQFPRERIALNAAASLNGWRCQRGREAHRMGAVTLETRML